MEHMKRIRTQKTEIVLGKFSSSRYMFLSHGLAKSAVCVPEKFFVRSFVETSPVVGLSTSTQSRYHFIFVIFRLIPRKYHYFSVAITGLFLFSSVLFLIETEIPYSSYMCLSVCCGIIFTFILFFRFRVVVQVEPSDEKVISRTMTKENTLNRIESIDNKKEVVDDTRAVKDNSRNMNSYLNQSVGSDAPPVAVCIHCTAKNNLKFRGGVVMCSTCSEKYCEKCLFREVAPTWSFCKGCMDDVCSMCSMSENIVLRRSKHGRTVCRDCKMSMFLHTADK
jgi:hypothetical protein